MPEGSKEESKLLEYFVLYFKGSIPTKDLYQYTFTLSTLLRQVKTEPSKNAYVPAITIANNIIRLWTENPFDAVNTEELIRLLREYNAEMDDYLGRLLSDEDVKNAFDKYGPGILKASVATLLAVVTAAGLKKYWPVIKQKIATLKKQYTNKRSMKRSMSKYLK